MKNKLFCMALSLSLFVMIGCDNSDDKAPQQIQTPAVLKGAIYSFEPKSTQWGVGKNIGVYMLKENTAEIVSPYDNVKYQTTIKPEGFFTPSVPENVLYYPADGSKVDVVAYYPLKEDMTDYLYPMNIAIQNTAANFSFLYAKNGKGLSKDNQKKTLEMRPVLAQLNFRLVAGDGVKEANLTNAVAKVSGMNTTAKFNVLTGEFMQLGDEKVLTLNPMKQYIGDSCQVFPVTLASTNKLSLKLPNLGNMSREFDLSTLTKEDGTLLTALEGGLRYNVSVTVGVEKAVIKLDGVEPIGSWTEGSTTNGSGIASPELLKNPIEWLSAGVMDSKVEDALSAPAGSWVAQLSANYVMDFGIEKDATLNKNVFHGNFKAAAPAGIKWYSQGIQYRMEKGELNAVYVVKFKVKGTKGKKLRLFVKNADVTTGAVTGKNTTNVFPSKASVASALVQGYIEVVLPESYEERTAEFSFSKMVEGCYGYTVDKVRDVTDVALANFYLGFYPTAVDTEFYLSDVSFTKK